MKSRPLFIARHGMYAAVAVAVLSAWLTHRGGSGLDTSLMRAVFVFVLFAGLAFGAEAVIATSPYRPHRLKSPPAAPAPSPGQSHVQDDS